MYAIRSYYAPGRKRYSVVIVFMQTVLKKTFYRTVVQFVRMVTIPGVPVVFLPNVIKHMPFVTNNSEERYVVTVKKPENLPPNFRNVILSVKFV